MCPINMAMQAVRAFHLSTINRPEGSRNTDMDIFVLQQEADLDTSLLRSFPTITYVTVESNATVGAELEDPQHGRHDLCSRQLLVAQRPSFSKRRKEWRSRNSSQNQLLLRSKLHELTDSVLRKWCRKYQDSRTNFLHESGQRRKSVDYGDLVQ
ncbi:hypothetical protein AVEN_185040-1 [Araneus ventricosus]|uniref:Uncharacterized protein n=1 Tax=Araneus ventricosus TaxID=182803 RepID=A0A4Y2BPE8_ARAVE|nr:hypothetical protein AVEN_185040-1 [Araneus ventricosus]